MTQITEADRDLARTLPLTSAAFATLFRQAQESPTRMVEIDALEPPQDSDTDRNALAFAYAKEHGYLPYLVQLVINRRISAEFVEAARAAGMDINDNTLQAMIDPANPAYQTGIYSQRLPRTSEQICRILVDGHAAGTGFLIRPRLVATAYHVLSELIEWDAAQDKWVGKPDSHSKITFEFGHRVIEVAGGLGRGREKRIAPQEDWVVDASPCHRSERMGKLPDNIDELEGHYDYVLCRLEALVSMDLKGVDIDTEGRLGPTAKELTIFQHANGAPLSHQAADTLRADETPYRVRHLVNTDHGSSGAPCFDHELRLLAMHQAGKQNGPGGALAHNANVCVPIYHWLPQIENLPVEDAGLMPLKRLSDGTPVFCRSALSNWAHATLTDAKAPAVLVVLTEALSGLTFTYRILRDLLPSEQHQVVHIAMPDVEASKPAEVLEYIRGCLNLGMSKPATREGVTAPPSDLKRVTVADLLDDIAELDRDVWLVCDGFDRATVAANDGGTIDVFNQLCESAGQGNRLRVILCSRVSDTSEPGVQLPRSVARSETEVLGPPTEMELMMIFRLASFVPDDSAPERRKIFLRNFGLLLEKEAEKNELFTFLVGLFGEAHA